jgi:hypothetical protein
VAVLAYYNVASLTIWQIVAANQKQVFGEERGGINIWGVYTKQRGSKV